MTDMILVYITCPTEQKAKEIGAYLLKKRVAACFNIISGMKSVYWWPPNGNELEEASETILIVKTLAHKFDAVEKEVSSIHPSDTPCLIAIPVTHVAKKYYEWIKGEIHEA